MSSKLLLNLQPDPNTGVLSQQLVDEAAEVLRYELGSANVTGDTVTLSFYDGTSNAGTLLGTVNIPANTDVETSPVTGSPGWSASDGVYVEVTAGEDNWINGQSFVDIARIGETDVRREADKDTSPIRLGAPSLEITAGAPSLTTLNARWRAWLLDAASTEQVTGYLLIPAAWATINVTLWWYNAGVNSGDVVFRAVQLSEPAGDALNASVATMDLTGTAGAQDVLVKSTFGSTFTPISGELAAIAIQRQGGAAADTLANDAGLLAVDISVA